MRDYEWWKGPFDGLELVWASVEAYDAQMDKYTTVLVNGRVVDYDAHERLVTIWTNNSETVEVTIEQVHFGNDNEVA